jgi:hypothetical protein
VFLQPRDGTVRVWRYLSLPKLLYGLEHRALVLPRLDRLKDPHEGTMTREHHRRYSDALQRVGIPSDAYEVAVRSCRVMPRVLRMSLFVSSWHVNDRESEAMWQLYCTGDEGVALQTTYAKLDESLPIVEGDARLYLGLVRYLDDERDIQPFDNVLDPVMHKRRAFEHEYEARVVRWEPRYIANAQGQRLETIPPAAEVPWDAESAVESVYVNPYAQQWYCDVVSAVLKRFAPRLGDRIKWSQIRSDPSEDD